LSAQLADARRIHVIQPARPNNDRFSRSHKSGMSRMIITRICRESFTMLRRYSVAAHD
jgi:hypothetical protein